MKLHAIPQRVQWDWWVDHLCLVETLETQLVVWRFSIMESGDLYVMIFLGRLMLMLFVDNLVMTKHIDTVMLEILGKYLGVLNKLWLSLYASTRPPALNHQCMQQQYIVDH